MKKVNEKGFTLAELLVVVAIIAVLVAVAIPTFGNQMEKSRQAVDISNLRGAYAAAKLAQISQALDDGVKFDATANTHPITPATEGDNLALYGASQLPDTDKKDNFKIIQCWYDPDTGELSYADEAAKADNSGTCIDATKFGGATVKKLLADASKLDTDIVKYTVNDALKEFAISDEENSKTGTQDKGILVVFEETAGGPYQLTYISYVYQTFSKKA